MTEAQRDELIDAYFEAMDTEDPSGLEARTAAEFRYESLSGVLEGYEGIRRYLDELRELSNTVHEANHRIHGENASAVEGTATAETPDGERLTIDFCNVFEFDDRDEQLTRIAVYVDSA